MRGPYGTPRVLRGYSGGTPGVLRGYSGGTPGVLRGYSGVLRGYSQAHCRLDECRVGFRRDVAGELRRLAPSAQTNKGTIDSHYLLKRGRAHEACSVLSGYSRVVTSGGGAHEDCSVLSETLRSCRVLEGYSQGTHEYSRRGRAHEVFSVGLVAEELDPRVPAREHSGGTTEYSRRTCTGALGGVLPSTHGVPAREHSGVLPSTHGVPA